jgi:histidine triad (HIT) family protein
LPEETIFSKIVRREIPAEIVYQDELVTAFKDINPRAPLHVLVIPNEPIPTAADVTEAHEALLGRVFRVATQVAAEAGVAERGYRLIVNCREHGGQEVDHLHMHVVGGRPLGRFLPD